MNEWAAEPTLADVERETGWQTYRGINGLCYAELPGADPPVTVRGEDPLDLRDEIRRAKSQLAEEEYRRHLSR